MLPQDLEDWLTDAGDAVVRKPHDTRSEEERLIYEIWLLDTEARNGGVSQYFCNGGLDQWRRCVLEASRGTVPSFAPFASQITRMIAGTTDPYEALIQLGSAPDDAWDGAKVAVVSELKASCHAL
jgi:hypothetical protein